MELEISGTHKLAGVGSLATAAMLINFTVSGYDFIRRSYNYSPQVQNSSVGGTRVPIYYRISTLLPTPNCRKYREISRSEMHSHVPYNL
jgi:hypothetical protein